MSGSFQMPSLYPLMYLGNKIYAAGIKISGDEPRTSLQYAADHEKIPSPEKILDTHFSPALDSIIYWLLQKSINLYGEALVKTFT